jgi:hypothetical protein
MENSFEDLHLLLSKNFIVSLPCYEKESSEYNALHFRLNEKNILFRKSKITPTKVGQFVVVWKRNSAGITQPFNARDPIDFFFILAQTTEQKGIFVFPKSILIQKGILTVDKKDGKRGFRVYPPWNIALNKQAISSQKWQLEYFLKWADLSENLKIII